MKQRLLFTLLALFVSIGLIEAKVTLTIPKGTTGSLSFSKASRTGASDIQINGVVQTGSSYTLKEDNELTQLEISGSLATLTVNLKVTDVAIENAADLTSLVFSSTAGSTISSFSFSGTGENKLKTLTVDDCGVTFFPGMTKTYLAEDATVSFKNNEITKISSESIIKDKKIKYDFSGNKIYSWPDLGENATSTITYGTQSLLIDLGKVKANEWFDIYGKLNTKISSYLGSGETWNVKASDLTVTWTGHNFEKETVTEGSNKAPRVSYRFWEGGKYVDGTFIAKVAIKNGPTYDNLKVVVTKASMPLTILDSEGGTLTATDKDGNEISGDVEEGTQITLNPAPKDGYIFEKFEYEGLEVVDADKHIYKVNIERDSKGIDVLSAKALFKKGTYTVTVEATGTENGNFKIINLSKSNEEFASTRNVSFGDKFKVEVTPAPGYRAIVKIDNQTQALDENNTCTFNMDDPDKTNITVTVSFELNATATLRIKVASIQSIKVDGKSVSWGGDSQNGYKDYTDKKYPIGQVVNITFKAAAGSNIQDVLVNAGNTECTKTVDKDGIVAISFKMPQEGAIVEVKLITGKDITVKSKTGKNEQEYTYDGKEHAFEYITDPSGLTCIVEYSADNGTNYYKDLPKEVGTYKVRISREADKNGLYNAIEKTTYANFTVEIVAAETVINSYPTVTINKDTKKYTISGGSANVTGKWEIVDTNGKVLTEAEKAESELVTVRFTPTGENENRYKVATAQVEARCDGKELEKTKITYTVPENSGITLVVKNGNKVLKSGDEVAQGTVLTYILTFPKGVSKIYLYEKDLQVSYGSTEDYEVQPGDGTEKVFTATANRATVNLEVRYEGTASVTKITPTFKESGQTGARADGPIVVTYNGAVQELYETSHFHYGYADEDYNEVTKLIQISYIDEKGNKLSAPINAGEYKVNITIPEYIGENTKYEAFDGVVGNVVYTINKATPEVSAWPEMAVVGVGKTLKYAKFGGASANVEGSFEFTQPDKTPTNGESYPIQFVPKDEVNYKVVAAGKEAKAVVTDQRILSISSYSNGTVTVTDQNGNELKDGAILGSNITSIKVTATPSTGYVLSSLRVNNSTISSGASYTLTGSEEIVAVSVTFARQYTITLGTAPRGVKIASKPTSNVVTAGGTYTFTLNHLSGDKPTVTGASNISVSTSGGTSTVTVSNIQSNATLAIAISATPIKITLEKTLSKAGKEMGTLRASGLNSSNECYYGDKVTITATANAGVEFSGWEGLTSTANPYEFEATQASYTFKAEYDGILTGIESVDEVRYYGADGYIYVNAPAPGTLTIISMNGRSQRLQVSGQTRVTVAAGIYGIVLDMDGEVIRDKVVVR